MAIDVDLALSNVHPPSSVTEAVPPRYQKIYPTTDVGYCESGKDAQLTWLLYTVREQSKCLVRDELKSEGR